MTPPIGQPAPPLRSARGCLAVCLLLLAAGAAAHLWYLLADCPLDLAGDEAHYWEWSRRLDLSYYSKGPLIAWLIAASRWLLADWSQRLVGSEMLAVRVPAILLSVLTGLGVFVLGRRVLPRPRQALAVAAITFTMPILTAGAILMTIDAPLACAWTWALICLAIALESNRTWAWVGVGLLTAVGLLAKYTMLLILPVAALMFVVEPRLRPQSRRPGPYLAAVIGLAGLAPIVLWNAAHGWVSFRHVAGQAGLGGRISFDPFGVLAYLGGQAAVVNPVWFVAMVWAAIEFASAPRHPAPRHPALHTPGLRNAGLRNAGLRNTNDQAPAAIPRKLATVATLVPLVVFLIFSPITKIQPNWPVLALMPGCVVLTGWLAGRLRDGSVIRRRRTRALCWVGVIVGAMMVFVAHRSDVLMPLFACLARGAPPWELTPVAKYDPSARLRGWSALGAAVGEVLAEQRTRPGDPFILADDYQIASEVAFYCPGKPTVFCVQSALGNRMCQYDLWPNPIRDRDQFLGRPCIYVGALHPELTGEGGRKAVLPGLERVRTVEFRVRGQVLQVWSVFVAEAFAGFDQPATKAHKY